MIKVNQSMYAKVFRELLDGPTSAHDLVTLTGMHIITAQSLMRTLKTHKVVHIAAWEKDSRGRDAIPVYAMGEGRDKKRARMSESERKRLSRERIKARKEQPVREIMGVRI
jgi:hypothetical protein